MVKEFVLIERGEYDGLKDNPTSNVNEIVSGTAPGSLMLSKQHLLSAIKNKVGTLYHNKVEQSFEFLKSHPSRDSKMGLKRKLPLLPLSWHTNTVDEN